MKLVILPGNGKQNSEWLEKASSYFKEHYADVYAQSYSHWESGGYLIDLEKEGEKLRDAIGQVEAIIVAKSIGAVLITYAIYKNYIHPTKCIFLGFPVRWAKKNNFPIEEWMRGYGVPTVFFHNENDPVSSPEELQDFLRLCGKEFKLITLSGEDHEYADFSQYIKNDSFVI